MFGVFATSANELEMDVKLLVMNSHVANSSLTVESLLNGKDASFASCRCLLLEGTARQAEAQHCMLHDKCMTAFFPSCVSRVEKGSECLQ